MAIFSSYVKLPEGISADKNEGHLVKTESFINICYHCSWRFRYRLYHPQAFLASLTMILHFPQLFSFGTTFPGLSINFNRFFPGLMMILGWCKNWPDSTQRNMTKTRLMILNTWIRVGFMMIFNFPITFISLIFHHVFHKFDHDFGV